MNVIKLFPLLFCLLAPFASAHSDFSYKVVRIDGLVPRLADLQVISKTPAQDRSIDLSDAFRKLGVSIPEWASVVYHPGSGSLICNLEPTGHDLVQQIIESIYETDNLIGAYRAYQELLEPLSSEDRLRTALRIGFIPDPLVAQLIREIQYLRSPADPPPADPFEDGKPKAEAKKASDPQSKEEEAARIAALEKKTSKLLDISLLRLKEQLATLDAAERK